MPELYDPYSHELHEDPYPVYRTLRDDHPLYYCESRQSWVLTRFEDVWNAVHEPLVYSSAKGVFPGMGELDPDIQFPVLIFMDPPRHTQLRSLVNRAFTRRRVADLEPSVRVVARELVDGFVEAGGGDLVEDIARPLPAIVIADLLGVPREDRKQFRHWSDQLVQDNPDDPAAAASALEGSANLLAYFEGLIAERRARPRDDLLNVLMTTEIEGEQMTEQELLGMSVLLLVAGNETTTNLVSNSAVLFAGHPDQWRSMVADPALLPSAIEESLRFDSPVQALSRALTTEVELHGRTIRPGETVLLVYGAANRDDREFPDADVFDVRRRVERQLAFGHGIHFCLGASLARLEARAVYSELLERAPRWSITGPSERLHSGPIRGLLRLPVTVDR